MNCCDEKLNNDNDKPIQDAAIVKVGRNERDNNRDSHQTPKPQRYFVFWFPEIVFHKLNRSERIEMQSAGPRQQLCHLERHWDNCADVIHARHRWWFTHLGSILLTEQFEQEFASQWNQENYLISVFLKPNHFEPPIMAYLKWKWKLRISAVTLRFHERIPLPLTRFPLLADSSPKPK